MPKVAEAKFSLISPGVEPAQVPRWNEKRAAEREELVQWRYLTACHSPSVEQLREKFINLELQGESQHRD